MVSARYLVLAGVIGWLARKGIFLKSEISEKAFLVSQHEVYETWIKARCLSD